MTGNWARIHRPRNMSEYMGEAIKAKIMPRLADKKLYPRVVLLEGTRGGGKTSMARLMAKEMLCLSPVNGHCCDKCAMCQEINEHLLYTDNGDGVDNILEINVATDGGKEAVTKIIEEMDIEPIYGDYKICILDECHRLSPAAQNALLKRLEEPKSYEVYILCTTDPDKLLQPIKSRCEMTLTVRPANIEELTARLIQICKEEKVEIGTEAAKEIAKACNCNPRESILKLEDLAKSHGYKVTIADVIAETGAIETDTYIEYFNAVNLGLSDIVRFSKHLKERNISMADFYKGLTNFVINCIYIVMGIGLDNYTKDYITRVKKFFKVYSSEDIDTLLQILEYTRKTIGTDESMGDLLYLTTSLRIGKVKMLSHGLSTHLSDATKETKVGNTIHAQDLAVKDEESSSKVSSEVVNDALIATVFGHDVSEVNSSRPNLFDDDESDTEPTIESDMDFLNGVI